MQLEETRKLFLNTMFYKILNFVIKIQSGDLDKMTKAGWAVFYHFFSHEGNQNHDHCPPECKFKRTGTYRPRYKYIPLMMVYIKSIFDDILKPENLKTCLPGLTTNANESFNGMIWRRVPKTVYVNRDRILLGVFDAIICRNESYTYRCDVLKLLGIEPGFNMQLAMVGLDDKRMINNSKSNKKANRYIGEDENYGYGAHE